MITLMVPTSQATQGQVDEAATLTATTCAEVTQHAFETASNQSVVGRTIELWLTGEASGDTKITLWKDEVGRVQGQILTTPAKIGSVCSQLKRMYMTDLSLTIVAAAQLAEIISYALSETRYPTLALLFEEAIDLTFNADIGDSIFFPSRNIHIEISNGLETASIEFQMPEPTADGVAFSGSLKASQPEAASWVSKMMKFAALVEADVRADKTTAKVIRP